MKKPGYKIDPSFYKAVNILKKDPNRNFYELEDLAVTPEEYQTYILKNNVIILITRLRDHGYDHLVRVVVDNYRNEIILFVLEFLAVKKIDKFILSINCLDNVNIDFLQKQNLVFRNIRNSYVKLRQLEPYFSKNIRELKKSDLYLAQSTKFPETKYRPAFEVLFNFFIMQKKGRILAFLHENKIIGYLSFIKSFANYWDVDYIYVAEGFRNQGIGTALSKVYCQTVLGENMIPYWSNASIAECDKVALKAGFTLCSRHWYFEKITSPLNKSQNENIQLQS